MWSVINSINTKIEDAGYEFAEDDIETTDTGTKLYKIVNTSIANGSISDIANYYTYDFTYAIGIVQGSDDLLCKEEKLDEVYNDIQKIVLDSIGDSMELFIKSSGQGYKNYTGPLEYNSTALLSFTITYKYR